VMTNYGFHAAMAEAGIGVATTKVGDRYVIEELLERGWNFGGEQSGHIIWTDFTPTGDGIAAALLALTALDGRDLADVEPFERLPQRLVNVELADPGSLEGATGLWEAVQAGPNGGDHVLWLVGDLGPREPQDVEARGDQVRLPAVVVLERGPTAVVAVAVRLHDQGLVAPQVVDDVVADSHVDLGRRQAVALAKAQEAALKLAAC
jgi:Phosphoglucomutase/phosphomannomutase, alpha/beta/alpha domain III